MRAFVIVLLALAPLLSTAAPTPAPPFAFEWAVTDSPPFHNASPPYQGQGFGDILIDFLTRTLSQYQHRITSYPHPRVTQLFNGRQDLCFPSMIKRDDTEFVIYSSVSMIYAAPALIADARSLALVDVSQVSQSLEALLSRPEIIFEFPQNRRFPAPIQRLLEATPHRATLNYLPGPEGTTRVLRRINMERVTFTIDYPSIVLYDEIVHGNSGLVRLAIAEYPESQVKGAIGCSNSAWGKHAIMLINQALASIREDKSYYQRLAKWSVFSADELHMRLLQAQRH